MSTLEKATLQELPSDPNQPPGDPVPVQFNPTSLRLHIANIVEGGQTRGKQVRQNLGKSSSTLAFDLVFDTADEGTTEAPRSVRERTASVEKFVLPKQGQTDAPPRVRFIWNDLKFDGLIESLDLDFDLFAANGTPLRAKCSVTIKEQDPKYAFLQVGDGAKKNPNAPAPGQAGGGAPGSAGGPANRSAAALAGESAADFAVRVGLDPSGWRGLSLGGSASLSLDAGVEIGFDASMTVGGGLGLSAGISAGASLSLESSFGLEASAGIGIVAGASVNAEVSAGFALSASGGVSAAIELVQIARSTAAADNARRAFAPSTPAAAASAGAVSVPPTPVSPRPGLPEQPRTPLTRGASVAPSAPSAGRPTASRSAASNPAPPPPLADPRAASFGFGVPLRPVVAVAVTDRPGAIEGVLRVEPSLRPSDPLFTDDPTVPPWIRLPSSAHALDVRPATGQPRCACGCRGACCCQTHGRNRT